MVLMELIGAAITYAAIKGGCELAEQYGKQVYPSLDDEEFDRHNMLNGINPYQIMQIAARNGVRPDKNGILPLYGYNSCIRYVRKYANQESDIQTFKEEWKRIVKIQEETYSDTIKKSNASFYKRKTAMFENMPDSGQNIILTYNHWWDLTPDEHNQRVHNIYHNTYMNKVATRPPIVRFDPDIYGKRTEVWEVKGKKGDKQDERQTMGRWRDLYITCCEKCGYDAKL